jgi:ATP-dependent RNA helicase RhlE
VVLRLVDVLFSGVRSPRSNFYCQIGFASRTHAAEPWVLPVAYRSVQAWHFACACHHAAATVGRQLKTQGINLVPRRRSVPRGILLWSIFLTNQSTMPVRDLRFGDLPVDARLASALKGMGYTTPTPIQEQAIPLLRSGRDVIGLARTGSGKTAGFGIPIIERVVPQERRVQALILTPTRELASQVAAALTTLGKQSGIRVVAVYGGVGMQAQIDALRGNAHVVVGTPGRVFDHITRGTLNLQHTKFVVLDEADRMLDVGFAPAIDKILSFVKGPRQTALFSATFPSEVEALGTRHTRDAVRVTVDPPGAALETLEERFVRVNTLHDKGDALHDILIHDECNLALVFRRTTHKADKLALDLEHRGFKVATLHGRRSQSQRERALGALRAGHLKVLVATDIAARGLDITGLTHVVNFDLPDTAENYTHRIGRTARMGANGVAITLVAPEEEADLRDIQRKLPPAPGRETPAPEPRRGAIQRALGRQPQRNDRGGWQQSGRATASAPRERVRTPEPRTTWSRDGKSSGSRPVSSNGTDGSHAAPHYPFRASRTAGATRP